MSENLKGRGYLKGIGIIYIIIGALSLISGLLMPLIIEVCKSLAEQSGWNASELLR
jgi:hypothetical protein